MSLMPFGKADPRVVVEEITTRWKAEAEEEKVVTEQERQEFNRSRRYTRRTTIKKARANMASNTDLITQAAAALDEAMKRNGFTERFHISIKGGR